MGVSKSRSAREVAEDEERGRGIDNGGRRFTEGEALFVTIKD